MRSLNKANETPSEISFAAVISGLFVICATALLLRLIGLDKESAWWDEYSSLVHLDRVTLWEFLRHNRTLDPATLPLYYSLEYLWSSLVGTNTYLMRIPSLAIGLACIPALYAVGAHALGRRAGLIAAALLALSPIHIFHAQGIRMYVLLTLLALLSMYTFIRLRDGGGRWWWGAHAAAQFLLSWTHPFALLVPVVQLFAWMTMGYKARMQVVRWGGLVALVWTPALIYLSRVEYWPEETTAGWFMLPTFLGTLADIFADDVVAATFQLRISPLAWQWFPALSPVLPTLRPIMDVALVGAFVAAVMHIVVLLRGKSAPQSQNVVLLLLWLVLPVLLLYVASLLIRPMIFPRYTVHCSLALYLLAGLGLDTIRLPVLRWAATFTVMGLMLFQTSLLHPGPQRSDYLGVARHIEMSPGSDTGVVIVLGELWRDVFAYNADTLKMPIIAGEDVSLCVIAARHYLAGMEGKGRVWLVAPDDYFDSSPDPELESLLASHSLDSSHIRFFGIRDIDVYEISGTGTLEADASLRKQLQSQQDTEIKRAAARTIAGTAASLAQQGRSMPAMAMMTAYFGEAVESDYLYGVLFQAMKQSPAESMDAFRTSVMASNQLGLATAGRGSLAAEGLIALAENKHAPLIVPVRLIDFAIENSALTEACIEAIARVRQRPALMYFHLCKAIAEGSPVPEAQERLTAIATLLTGLLKVADTYPADIYFHLTTTISKVVQEQGNGVLSEGLIDALTVALEKGGSFPDDTYFHLEELLTSLIDSTGCTEDLSRILALAEALAPLNFQTGWFAVRRACEEGRAPQAVLDAKVLLSAGMTKFEEGDYEAASSIFTEAQVDGFGMPTMLLGVSRLALGDKDAFRALIPQAIEKDPGIAQVYGPYFSALLRGDRASAVEHAEAFRGKDLDNADILLSIIDMYLEPTPALN